MITRLKVKGFKNLLDVDVRFGSFTCIAGVNGVGKSNLFDAIKFLSNLASGKSLIDSTREIRDSGKKNTDVKSLFYKSGNYEAKEMTFEVEMLIPAEGFDEFGELVKASRTFLIYEISIEYSPENKFSNILQITKESLKCISKRESASHLLFRYSNDWFDAVIKNMKTTGDPFIQTINNEISIRKDQWQGGHPISRTANKLPRTVLSSAKAIENPTAFLVKQEMESWQFISLEPTSMRESSEFISPKHLSSKGGNIPSSLYHLASQTKNTNFENNETYLQVANSLSELVNSVKRVWVEKDEIRQLLSLKIRDKNGTEYSTNSLSDGTLRFIAFMILKLDPEIKGIICLEEPENGIYPKMIKATINLLEDIAVDTEDSISDYNPLRQVLINTHSPTAVSEISDADLVVAETEEKMIDGKRCKSVVFKAINGSWRTKDKKTKIVSFGTLISYLNPVNRSEEREERVFDIVCGKQEELGF